MFSFISNFKHAAHRREAVFFSVLLTAAAVYGLVNLWCYYRYEKDSVTYKEVAFWGRKCEKKEFDIVLIGDSRTYRGVNTELLEQKLHAKAYNFAFSSGSCTEEIFDYVDRSKLRNDGAAGPRMIIMGITPGTLVESNRDNTLFRRLANKSTADSQNLVDVFFAKIDANRLRNLKNAQDELSGEENKEANTVFDIERGWASTNIKPDARLIEKNLDRIDSKTINAKLSEKSVAELLARTKAWTERGILVVGFRPPSTERLTMIENSRLNYDEEALIRQFEAAGGVYVRLDQTGYECYDGVHLSGTAATAVAEDLLTAIQKRVPPRAP